MQKIQIEQAGIQDLDLLMKLRMRVIREVFDCNDPEILDPLKEENRLFYQKNLVNGNHIACIVRNEDGEIAGCGGVCFYSEMPSPDNPNGRCAYLMNIFTFPEFRQQGIARQTVRWLINKAIDRNCHKIYLETSEDAWKLYLSTGFEEMEGYLKLNLKKYQK